MAHRPSRELPQKPAIVLLLETGYKNSSRLDTLFAKSNKLLLHSIGKSEGTSVFGTYEENDFAVFGLEFIFNATGSTSQRHRKSRINKEQ